MQKSQKLQKIRQNSFRPRSLSPMIGLSSNTNISNTSLPTDLINNAYILPKFTNISLPYPPPIDIKPVEEAKASLFQKLALLEKLHKSDSIKIEQQERTIKDLTDQLDSMKASNKSLLEEKGFTGSDLHSLYQNLFITDLKQQMTDMNDEINRFRSEKEQLRRELESTKKENVQLQASIKRYRMMIVKGIKKDTKHDTIDDGSSVVSGIMSESDRSPGRHLDFEKKRVNSEYNFHAQHKSNISSFSMSRIEKLNLVLIQLNNCTNINQLCKIMTRATKSLTKSQKVTIYIVGNKAREQYIRSYSGTSDFIGRVRVANSWMLMHTHKEAYQEEPLFKKFEDLKYPIRQTESLIMPIFRQRELDFVIQAQEKKGSENKHIIYLPADELILKIVSNAVLLKVESLYALEQEKIELKHSGQLAMVATSIIKCLTHKEIANSVRSVIPEYFGFENAGIVFIDNKSHQFYVMIHDPSSDGYFGEGYLRFPFGIGLTGQAISRDGVSVFHNPKTAAIYNPEIDNVGWIHETKCIMMGCLKDWNGNLIGVIQLTNKKYDNVEIKDIKRLETLLDLLGTCIASTNLSVEQFSLTIKFREIMQTIMSILAESDKIGNLDGELNSVVNQMSNLKNSFTDWFRNKKPKF